MDKVLVLAGGLPQIELIKKLKERGYITILADYFPNPIAKSHADIFYQESTLDVEAMRRIAIEEKVKYVITCCTDQALATVSAISSELGLPCYIDSATGMNVTNKFKMKDIFKKYNIPTAEHIIVNEYRPFDSSKYPLVVKPVDCNSSKGVVKVTNDEELRIAIDNAIEFSRTSTAIVEQYINGDEISVDIFVNNGKAQVLCMSRSDKIKDEHKFVICRTLYPPKISDVAKERIEAIAQKIVDAFGLKNCPMLMQTLVEGDNVYVVEFSARTGGCLKYRLIDLAAGIDIISATIDLFEGKTVSLEAKRSEKFIVNEFIYCSSGVFDHLQGFDECVEKGMLEGVFMLKNPGERFEKAENSGDRVAAITYVADSYDDYVDKFNYVSRNIQVIDTCGKDIMRHDLLTVAQYKND